MNNENVKVIKIQNLSKYYKLYDKPIDRLKEDLGIFKKKKYHKVYKALENVTFDVYKGETIGIIGKNGAGKSTLLKIITGVLGNTSGNIEVRGKISALLELGAGFNPEYTGKENIYLNAMMMGFSREEVNKKIDNIIEFADIGEFISQPVKTYSSGMFVRLAFAVAINVEPEILIVDEALAVGDIFFQNKCYKKFEEFKEKGKTIIFVTHSMDTIIAYCDRAILLNDGKKVSEGNPADMVNEYKKMLSEEYEHKKIKEKVNQVHEDNFSVENWKDKMYKNEKYQSYGNKMAEIVDYGIFDHNKLLTNRLEKNKDFEIKMVVKFKETIKDPIFAFTVKDIKGNEITGTNTYIEKKSKGVFKKGRILEVSFKQKLTLQNMDYIVSLGCTGFEGDNLVIYHRLYDVFAIEIISYKNTVGFFDMYSNITLKDVGEK